MSFGRIWDWIYYIQNFVEKESVVISSDLRQISRQSFFSLWDRFFKCKLSISPFTFGILERMVRPKPRFSTPVTGLVTGCSEIRGWFRSTGLVDSLGLDFWMFKPAQEVHTDAMTYSLDMTKSQVATGW